MTSLRRFRPSPAMVVACIALTVALSGTSYAAIKLPKNSVGTKQLKKNAVTSVKVKANAITSPKVKNDALTGADVLESSLAQVPSAATAGTAAPSGAASGSLAGAYPAPSIAANVIGSSNVLDASQGAGLRKADVAAVVATVNFDPPSIAANDCGTESAPLPGAQTGDAMVLMPVSATWAFLVWNPWTVVTNTVYITVCNPTAFAVNGVSTPFQVLLFR